MNDIYLTIFRSTVHGGHFSNTFFYTETHVKIPMTNAWNVAMVTDRNVISKALLSKRHHITDEFPQTVPKERRRSKL